MTIYAKLAAALVVLALITGGVWKIYHTGFTAGGDAQRVQDAKQKQLDDQYAARELQRRLERQKESDDANAAQLAVLRAAAGRADDAAERMREQRDSALKSWVDALNHSPTEAECAAAGVALGVQADVLGRIVAAAKQLAATADSARAAGQQCERDYDALTPPLPSGH